MTALPVSRTRIRRVRFKSGGSVELLKVKPNFVSARFERATHGIKRDLGERMAGYAIVAWGRDGTVSYSQQSTGSPVPSSGIPAFVHDVLVMDRASAWTQIDIFGPPQPEGA